MLPPCYFLLFVVVERLVVGVVEEEARELVVEGVEEGLLWGQALPLPQTHHLTSRPLTGQ